MTLLSNFLPSVSLQEHKELKLSYFSRRLLQEFLGFTLVSNSPFHIWDQRNQLDVPSTFLKRHKALLYSEFIYHSGQNPQGFLCRFR